MQYVAVKQNEFVDFVDNVAYLIGRARQAYASHVAFKRTVNELSNLSDRALADVGLERKDIVKVAQRGAAAF